MSGRDELLVGDKPLSALRVVDLKAELEKRGLSKSGSKKDLVDRLKASLTIDHKREEAAVVEDEELPNISAKLPDDNPFVREYLTSQAELFHSQQVAKKLYREEQRRESEGSGASADERERSPLKSPSKFSDSSSPVRHQADDKTESSDQDKSPQKRSTRSCAASTLPVPTEETVAQPQPVTDDTQPEATLPNPTKVQVTEAEPKEAVPETVKLEVILPKDPEAVQTASGSRRGRKCSRQDNSDIDKPSFCSTTVEVTGTKTDAVVTREKSPERRSTRRRAGAAIKEEPAVPSDKKKFPREEDPVAHSDKDAEAQSPLKICAGPSAASQSEPGASAKPAKEEDKTTMGETVPPSKEASPEAVPAPTSHDPLRSEEESSIVQAPLSPSPTTKRDEVNVTTEVTVIMRDKSPSKLPAPTVDKLPNPAEVLDKPPTLNAPPMDKLPAPESPAKRSRRSRFLTEEEHREMEAEKSRSDAQLERPRLGAKPPPLEEVLEKEIKPVENVQPTEDSSSSRKIRSHSPITAPEPDKKPNSRKGSVNETENGGASLKRSNSQIVDKQSILDEVLDYGEEDVEMDSTSPAVEDGSKGASIIPLKSRPSEDLSEAPSGTYVPIQYDRRVLKLKSNRHTQRRKDKMEDDLKRRENEKEKAKAPAYVITSQLLREWYPDMVMLTDEEVGSIDAAIIASSVEDKVRITRTFSNVESIEGDGSESGKEEEKEAQPEMDLSIQRKDDDAKKGELTPPRRAPTHLILVTNLVRPFTVTQLKELLQRTGNVVDLWVDKIKSRCVAKYDSEDEALETRTALHGVKWPSSNPKALSVDFTTDERAEDLRKKDSGYIEEKSAPPQHVREWDVGKQSPPRQQRDPRKRPHSRSPVQKISRSFSHSRRSRSRSGQRTRHSRSPRSDRKHRNGDIKKSESSGKTLDELFRKTVATPCIYWLPLNPQQILEKEELRRKRMEERERRIAEMQQRQRSSQPR